MANLASHKFSIIYLMRIRDMGQKMAGSRYPLGDLERIRLSERSPVRLPFCRAPWLTQPADKRYTLADLLAVMARLRDKDTGCPWDVEQTFSTIAPYTIEEAYEVADAIARDDLDALKDELGDLLLQVVYHAQMASEDRALRLQRCGRRDHPQDDPAAPACVRRREPRCVPRRTTCGSGSRPRRRPSAARRRRSSRLDDVPLALPALTRAVKLQKRAAEVGFDWPSLAPVLAKAEEEIAELKAAIAESEGEQSRHAACRRGVRRPAVRHGEYRAASRRRSGSRACAAPTPNSCGGFAVSRRRSPRTAASPKTRRSRKWTRCGTRRRRPRKMARSYSAASRRRAGPARRASRSRFSGATRMRKAVMPSPTGLRSTTSQFS